MSIGVPVSPLEELDFPVELSERLCRWAAEAGSQEACGALVGRRVQHRLEVCGARLGENLAKRADRFELDPGELVSWELEAADRGQELVAIWHSHLHGPAQLSALDRRARLGSWAQVVVALEAEPERRVAWFDFEHGHWRERR